MNEENITLEQVENKENVIKKLENEKQELQSKMDALADKLNKEEEELKLLKTRQNNIYDKLECGDVLVFKDEDNIEIEIMLICKEGRHLDGLFLTDYSEVCEAYGAYSSFGYKYFYADSLINGILKDMEYMEWKLIDVKYDEDN